MTVATRAATQAARGGWAAAYSALMLAALTTWP